MSKNKIETTRKWREKNRKKIRKREKEWRIKNTKHVNAWQREWRKKNQERAREHSATAYKKKAEWIASLKDKPCTDCGIKYPPECMDWDHVKGKKLFSIAKGIVRAKEKTLAEIAKCELVCANCHRIRTKRRKNASLSLRMRK